MGLHHASLFLVVIMGSFLRTTQDNKSITVQSCQYTDVLLECDCSKKTPDLKWQKESNPKRLIYSNNTISKDYTDRIEMFPNEHPENCSIRLKNITKEDGGNYLCRFQVKPYLNSHVKLEVNTNLTECPGYTNSSSRSNNGATERSVNPPSTDRPAAHLAFIIIPALLLFGCIFLVLQKRRNQLQAVKSVGCHPLLSSATPCL